MNGRKMDFDLLEFYRLHKKTKTKKNLEVFTESYIPERIPHRIDDMKMLTSYILKRENILLEGQPSCGKTVLVRKVFNILRQEEDEEFIYVNCWTLRNKSRILSEIVSKLGGDLPSSGLAIADYEREIEKLMKKKTLRHIYFCFDEYDNLTKRYNDLDDMLYYFANSDSYKVILIANTHEWFDETHELRTRSRFHHRKMFLKDYSVDEIEDILKERLIEGLPDQPNFLTDSEIQALAEISYNQIEKLRIGIHTLGELIDEKIKTDKEFSYYEIESLFKTQIQLERTRTYSNLPLTEKFIIEILISIYESNHSSNNWRDPTIDYITKLWNKNCEKINLKQISSRQLRRFIKNLLDREVIKEVEPKSYTGQGRPPTAYNINFDIAVYKEELKKTKKTSP